MIRIAAALALALPARPASAETLTGRASVIDCDALEIRGDRVRLSAIDRQRHAQPRRPAAKPKRGGYARSRRD